MNSVGDSTGTVEHYCIFEINFCPRHGIAPISRRYINFLCVINLQNMIRLHSRHENEYYNS